MKLVSINTALFEKYKGYTEILTKSVLCFAANTYNKTKEPAWHPLHKDVSRHQEIFNSIQNRG